MKEKRWIIVSNRLPFSWEEESKSFVRSSGGLITAIEGIQNDNKKIWCGIAPSEMKQSQFLKLQNGNQKITFEPIFIESDQYDAYYNGFSNSVLWPLLHYEIQNLNLRTQDWEAYCSVNKRIAEEVAAIAEEGDLIWVHDFHLLLVPQYLRKLKPSATIGFFLHVPFPSSEIWRQLPMRAELLKGLLGADLIGFHDFSYLRHFGSCVELLLGINPESYLVRYKERFISLGVFPVSIDTPSFSDISNSEKVKELVESYVKGNSYQYTILGIDRLDYTKGIDLKLQAFEKFLESYPEYASKVRLLQIAVPTRVKVEEYQDLKNSIEQTISSINGRFGTLNEAPITYLYSSIKREELIALYRMADILLVSSKRDGMNLVCQEFIACQDAQDPGMVILSEFAGAASNLSRVLTVNPWDVNEVSSAISECITMPKEEKIKRHSEMYAYLQDYTATAWAEFFMEELEVRSDLRDPSKNVLEPRILNLERDSLSKEQIGKPDLHIFIDFDGTLAPIGSKPELVNVTKETRGILEELSKKKGVKIIITSGRDAKFLLEQFSGLDIFMAAEHGAEFFDHRHKEWTSLVRSDVQNWYEQADKLLKEQVKRVPGSFLEKKRYGLAWHYRLAPKDYSEFQARKIAFELRSIFKDLPVVVMLGKKVIEVKSFEADKGIFARWYLDQAAYDGKRDGVVAIGDDITDEDMFKVLHFGMTIKIGSGFSDARYYIDS